MNRLIIILLSCLAFGIVLPVALGGRPYCTMAVKFQLPHLTYTVDDGGCYQSRSSAVQKIISGAVEKHLHNHLVLHSTQVATFVFHGNDVFPVEQRNRFWHLCQSNSRDLASTCFPDFFFGGWPEVGMPSFDAMVAMIGAAGRKEPEIDRLFWIGATSHPNRQILLDIGKQHPELIDARAITWQGSHADHVSLADHPKFRYLIDVEGNGWSARLKLLLWSRRLLFIQDREHWCHVGGMLQPWVHYVPVARNMSDLLERLAWAKAPENQRIVSRMIANALVFAQHHVSAAAAELHMARVLKHALRSSVAAEACARERGNDVPTFAEMEAFLEHNFTASDQMCVSASVDSWHSV